MELEEISVTCLRNTNIQELFHRNGPFENILTFLPTYDILLGVSHSCHFLRILAMETLILRDPKKFEIKDFFFDSVERKYYRSVQYMMTEDLFDESAYYQELFEICENTNDIEMVKVLLSRNRIRFANEIEEDNDTAILTNSIKEGNYGLFKVLVNYEHTDFSYKFNHPLRLIVDRNLPRFLRRILKNPKIDPSVSDEYCLRTAVKNGYMEIVRLLLSSERVDPTYNDFHLIGICSKLGHHDILKLLLEDYRVQPPPELFKGWIEECYKQSDLESVKILTSHCEIEDDDEYLTQMRNMVHHPLYKVCEYFSISYIACFITAFILAICYVLIGIVALIVLFSIIDTSVIITVLVAVGFVVSAIGCLCLVILIFATVGAAARGYYQNRRWRDDHGPFSTV